MSYALGVDIGTTFSAAAVFRQGRAEMVSLGYRSALVPSAVLITSTNETLVGDAALRRGQSEPERLARFFKRRIGDSVPLILGGSPLSSETLTGRLLRAVIDQVVEQQGGPPESIAVTRPANWGPFKQDRFDQALRLADVRAATVLTEPEAAALAYAAEERIEPGAVVAVYDLGGGTFDATVLRRTGDRFEVVGEPEGIERLGGIDFDAAVFEHVRRSLYGAIEALDEDDPLTLRSITRLRNECVDAKEALSSDTQASIPVVLPGLSTEVRLTRAELETMIRPSLDDSIAALRRAVVSAGVEPSRLDRVLLVGGSSRIPLVAQMVASAFGRPVALDAHPKNAVALGAALVAGGEGIDGRAIGATHTPPAGVAPAASPASPASAGSPASSDAGTHGSGLAAAGLAGAGAAAVVASTAGAEEALSEATASVATPAPPEPDVAPEAPSDRAEQPFAPVAFDQGPAAPHETPVSSDGSLPAVAPGPTPTESGDTRAPAEAASPAGPAVDDTWVTPPAPTESGVPSGDTWAPAAEASSPARPAVDDTWVTPAPPTESGVPSGDTWVTPPTPTESGVPSGDTWVTPPTPTEMGVPSGDTWVTPPTPLPSGPGDDGGPTRSGDDWPASGREERDDGRGRGGRAAAGLAAGAAIAAGAAGTTPAGASPAYGETAYETASASGPAAPTWSPGAPDVGSGSYAPAGGPAGRTPTPSGRKWFVPAAAAVAAVVLGVGGFMAFAAGDDDDPNNDAGTTTTAANQTDNTNAVDDTAGTGTSQVAQVTQVSARPEIPISGNGDGIAMDDQGRLWTPTISPDQLLRITDPDGAATVESIPLTDWGDDPDPLAVTYADGYLWVTLRLAGKTLQIDPDVASTTDNGVVQVYETGPQPSQVVAGGGFIWVVSAPRGNGTTGTIHRITPGTADPVSVDLEKPMGLLVDPDGRVWVTHANDQLQELRSDDLSNVNEPITVGTKADELAYVNDAIWVADRGDGTLTEVDRDSRETAKHQVGGNPAGIRASDGRLWVVDTAEAPELAGQGRLLIVDPATGDVTAQAAVGARPLGVLVEGTRGWVTRHDEPFAVIPVDGA